jgi:uncharacterized protein YggU (UPF0235/DUF167 family)
MYIRVHAHPGARKERVVRESESTFLISVKEPAERNMANGRIREILAEELGIPVTQIRLLTGHRSSSKMYSVER